MADVNLPEPSRRQCCGCGRDIPPGRPRSDNCGDLECVVGSAWMDLGRVVLAAAFVAALIALTWLAVEFAVGPILDLLVNPGQDSYSA